MVREMICQKVSAVFHLSCEMHTDSLATAAFYMVGDIDSARSKGEKILADLEKS